MINFYIKEKISPNDILNILSEIFNTSTDSIIVISVDELNTINLSESKLDKIVCLCSYTHTSGDACLLIDLYRCKMNDETFLNNLINVSKGNNFSFYFPFDDFDGWLYIKKGDIYYGKELETKEEKYFLFAMKQA